MYLTSDSNTGIRKSRRLSQITHDKEGKHERTESQIKLIKLKTSFGNLSKIKKITHSEIIITHCKYLPCIRSLKGLKRPYKILSANQ